MDCDQIRDLLASYAVGALDADERPAVAQHLDACPACRRLAEEWAAIAHTLPLALGTASPQQVPPVVKQRLLASLPPAALPPTATVDGGDRGQRPVSATVRDRVAAAAPRHPAGLVPGFVRPGWRRRSLATAAVVLLVLSLAGVTVARERALRAEFADLVAQQEVVLEVIDSAQTVRVVLRPPTPGSPAYGKLYTRPDLPHVVAMAARLPLPPSGQAYHLWVSQAGQTRLAGMLAINEQGFGLLIFDADRPGPHYDAVQLTLQPVGGTSPAAPPVLRWEAPR